MSMLDVELLKHVAAFGVAWQAAYCAAATAVELLSTKLVLKQEASVVEPAPHHTSGSPPPPPEWSVDG